MNLYGNDLYLEDIEYVCSLDLPWEKLKEKSVLLSGATGLVGSFLVDVLLSKGIDCTVYALGRNEEKAKTRFSKWADDEHLIFIPYDINKPLVRNDLGTIDYVLHMASNTHPMQYSTDPIGTITTNIIGVQNMLEFAVEHHAIRFAFTSSNEIKNDGNNPPCYEAKQQYIKKLKAGSSHFLNTATHGKVGSIPQPIVFKIDENGKTLRENATVAGTSSISNPAPRAGR